MNATDSVMRVTGVAAPIRQQVAASFRSAILSGRFGPGDRLVEKELCELTGASRTSVREALRQLETEGLITIVPNRGPIVAQIDPIQARNIYEVRAALEGLAASLFVQNATKEQVGQLETAAEEVLKAYKVGDIDDILKTKDVFYDILLDGSQNDVARSVLAMMHARISLLRRVSLGQPARLAKSSAEIKSILRAIKARDADAARDTTVQHVHRAASAALSVVAHEHKKQG
jgi:DNA-binding GntR family transcriptional regulator